MPTKNMSYMPSGRPEGTNRRSHVAVEGYPLYTSLYTHYTNYIPHYIPICRPEIRAWEYFRVVAHFRGIFTITRKIKVAKIGKFIFHYDHFSGKGGRGGGWGSLHILTFGQGLFLNGWYTFEWLVYF